MIVDGRALAAAVLKEVRETVTASTVTVRVIVMKPSAATESYLRIKESRAHLADMYLEIIRMENDATEDDIIRKIQLPGADAILVQLPLPEGFDTARVLDAIPVEKDADVLSSAAYEKFERGDADAVVPPVAAAVAEILMREKIEVAGKRAVVVGQGKLVGRPVLTLLRRLGADALTVLRDTPNPGDILRGADIIVSGVGQAHFITPDMVKDGAILIDAGTSGAEGSVAGDMDPACAEKASLFTPVPGGVGPLAVAMLFKNVSLLSPKDR